MAIGRNQAAIALMWQAIGSQHRRDFAGNQVIGVDNIVWIFFDRLIYKTRPNSLGRVFPKINQ
jgi:hypothetical protein